MNGDIGQVALSKLEVMNFLNEISIDYPRAISFASGRPTEKYFHLDDWAGKLSTFAGYFARQKGIGIDEANGLIGQYGRTNGMINELIAQQVKNDENIVCQAEDIVVTSGCQEAMLLSVESLIRNENDVLLVCDPTYIGITGLAATGNIPLDTVPGFANGNLLSALEAKVAALAKQNRRVAAFYIIPDFDNPTGAVMALEERMALLAFCSSHGIMLLEDNPYGMFRYDGEREPTLYELDTEGSVIYLGTYAKSLCPAIRVGYLILPQTLHGDVAGKKQLLSCISRLKSFVTVNTGQISQGILGGVLLDENLSVSRLVEGPRRHYLANRNLMLRELESNLGGNEHISWTSPAGGFFLTVTLDFDFLKDEALECAEQNGVICMPMSFFAFGDDCDNVIRLAFSNVEPEDIETGVARLAAYLQSRSSACRLIRSRVPASPVLHESA